MEDNKNITGYLISIYGESTQTHGMSKRIIWHNIYRNDDKDNSIGKAMLDFADTNPGYSVTLWKISDFELSNDL